MKKAFTIIETAIVITILGIIAAIMLSTLKPQELKDDALEVLKNKALEEIDEATQRIILDNTTDGTLETIVVEDGTTCPMYSVNSNCPEKISNLYKKYLTATRKPENKHVTKKIYGKKLFAFYLKDGTWIGFSPAQTSSAETNAASYFVGLMSSLNGINYGMNEYDTTKAYANFVGIMILDLTPQKRECTTSAECSNINNYKGMYLYPVGINGIMYNYNANVSEGT